MAAGFAVGRTHVTFPKWNVSFGAFCIRVIPSQRDDLLVFLVHFALLFKDESVKAAG